MAGIRNIALTLEYDGTAFAGSQFQVGERTVQGELEAAWTKLTGDTLRWSFAGRTDAGVHARGQVANAHTHTSYDLPTIQRALNALGPRDLGVRGIREVPLDFHARFSAWRRDYRYLILNERWPAPLLRTRMLHVPQALDVAAMDDGIRRLVGEHDFVSFGTVSQGSTVRQCFEARCFGMTSDDRQVVVIEISANGFLRHMVRAITGTLVQVGLGKLTPADVSTILQRRDRAAGGPGAAPHGLYLESVRYDDGATRRMVVRHQENVPETSFVGDDGHTED